MAGSKEGNKLFTSRSNVFSKEFISTVKKAEEIYSFPVSSLNRYITMYIYNIFEKKKER